MLNKVTLIGNLGADPEIRYMPAGGAVATISLATTRRWKDKKSGERKDATEWHRVVFFSPLAEIVGEYLKKGRQIYVEGRLQTRKWQTQDGQDRYTTEIVANEMSMLGTRSGGTGEFSHDYPTSETSSAPGKASAHTAMHESHQTMAPPPPPQSFEDFDDDIPF